MSNIIPPLLSDSPPPINGSLDEEDDDEFGDFTSAVDLSYNCEALSLPPSPLHSPPIGIIDSVKDLALDINSNNSKKINNASYVNDQFFVPIAKNVIDKDYQDKRKNCDTSPVSCEKPEVNSTRIGVPKLSINSVNNIQVDEKSTCRSELLPNNKDTVPIESDPNVFVSEERSSSTVSHFEGKSTDDGFINVPSPVNDLTILNNSVDKPNRIDELVDSTVIRELKNEDGADYYLTEEPPDIEGGTEEFGDFKNFNERCSVDSPTVSLQNESVTNIDLSLSHRNSAYSKNDDITTVEVEEPHELNLRIHGDNDGKNESLEFGDYSDNVLTTADVIISNAKLPDFQQAENLSDSADTDKNDVTLEAESELQFATFTSKSHIEYSGGLQDDFFTDFSNFPEASTSKGEDQYLETESIAAFSANDDDDDDEFGDFDDYTQSTDFANFESTSATVSKSVMNFEGRNIFEEANVIIADMFPVVVSEDTSDAVVVSFVDNSVFKELKDITETNALTHQWTKSVSQSNLLKALNIDTRNILYGPGWNSSMPRFAANLSFTPLEPVKSTEVLTPTPTVSNPSHSSQPSPVAYSVQPEIPTAQFDWNGSGLTNPLDCTQAGTMLLDLEQLVASLDVTNSSLIDSLTPSPSHTFNDWEYLLIPASKIPPGKSTQVDTDDSPETPATTLETLPPRLQADNESVNSLQFTTDSSQDVEESKTKHIIDEIKTTKSSSDKKIDESSNWSSNVVPLRETYISNRTNEQDSEPGWLKPTLLTPDLLRKAKETFGGPSLSQSDMNSSVTEDDFGDFQKSSTVQPEILQPTAVLEPLKPTILQPQVSRIETTRINWPDPGITEDDIRNIELNYSSAHKMNNSDVKTIESKESMSKISVISDESVSLGQDILVNNFNFTSPDLSGSKIVSDIKSTDHLHANVSSNDKSLIRKVVNKKMLEAKTSDSVTTNAKADDDDDWSDFVCNPEPLKPNTQASKMYFPGVNQPDRSGTPELQLSVPQLSHLQPPKAPIPVITPHGLLQTKIPSNVPNIRPSFQPSVPPFAYQHQSSDGFRPSIISNQYQNHMSGPIFAQSAAQPSYSNHLTNSAQQKNGFVAPPFSSSLNSSLSTRPQPLNSISSSSNTFVKNEDDDWTDFISVPPTTQTGKSQQPNGMAYASRTSDWNKGPHFNSWSSTLTPNIITNPVHFESHRGYLPQGNDLFNSKTNRKVTNISLQSKRSTIPSISSLPDLDFIAPKSRTYTKK